MYYYKVYGLVISSNVFFPQLLPISENNAKTIDVEISVCDSNETSVSEEEIRRCGTFYGKTKNGVWFKNQAGKFGIETIDNKSYINCTKYSDVHISNVRSFILGNVSALMLTQRGKIVIHGSTLLMDDKAVMICGDSGAGKSTLSMELINKGAKLMSDDISVIDGNADDGYCYVYAGFPEQKLCKDAALARGLDIDKLDYVNEDKEKYSLIRNDIFEDSPRKVEGMIVIKKSNKEDNGNSIRCNEIVGAEKVNSIIHNFFLYELYSGFFHLKPDEMMKCIVLAQQIRIFEFIRNSKVDTVNELAEAVTDSMTNQL